MLVIGVAFIIKAIIIIFISSARCFEVNDIAITMFKTGEMKYFLNGHVNYNYQFPVYPFLIYLIYSIFGIYYKYVLFFNLIISSASAYFLYYLLDEFMNLFNITELNKYRKKIVFISVILFLSHPLISYYTIATIHPFALDLFISIVVLYQMFRFINKPNTLNLLIYSLLIGLGILNRTTAIVLIVPFIIISIQKLKFISTLKHCFVIIFISIIISGGWVIRNYIKDNTLLINSSIGQNLWIGIQEKTEGTAQMQGGKNYFDLLSKEELKSLPKLSAEQQNNLFLTKYLIILKSEPLHVIKMFFIKLKNFWFFRSNIGIDYSRSIANYIIIYKIIYIIVLLLALISIFMLKAKAIVLLSYPICLSIFQSIIYVETRHRIIIEPFIIFLSIISIYYIYTHYFKREIN